MPVRKLNSRAYVYGDCIEHRWHIVCAREDMVRNRDKVAVQGMCLDYYLRVANE